MIFYDNRIFLDVKVYLEVLCNLFIFKVGFRVKFELVKVVYILFYSIIYVIFNEVKVCSFLWMVMCRLNSECLLN